MKLLIEELETLTMHFVGNASKNVSNYNGWILDNESSDHIVSDINL